MLLACLALLSGCGLALWRAAPERKPYAGWAAGLAPLVLLGYLWFRMGPSAQMPYAESWPWVDSVGLELALRVDGLGFLFTVIILLIGAAVAHYTHYYLYADARQGSFYLFLFLFMACMLGIVWADNVLLLFIFWEGTSITSYLLIGYRYDSEISQKAARNALFVTGAGGLCLLWGLLLLAAAADSYSVSYLVQAPWDFAQPNVTLALVLLLVGAFTKSGQFPFHFWLPGAMTAPTPASAYLHSATMVKAGVFLAARFHPLFAEHPAWLPLLAAFGTATAVLSAFTALTKTDLKAVLAYATLAQLGLLFVALSMTGEAAALAAVLGILAHALYKGSLFLVVGLVEHAASTRIVTSLAALARPLKAVFAATLLAALSLMSIPVWPGFVAKEYLLDALQHQASATWSWLGWLSMFGVVAAGAAFVAIGLVFLVNVFLRATPDDADTDLYMHLPPKSMVVGPLSLSAVSLALPLVLNGGLQPLLAQSAASLAGPADHFEVHLWNGWGLPLALSAAALLMGAATFRLQPRLRALAARSVNRLPAGETLFDLFLHLLRGTAERVTDFLQSRSLTTHIAVVLAIALAFVTLPWRRFDLAISPDTMRIVSESRVWPLLEIVLAALAIAAALTAVLKWVRLTAVIALSVVGLVVALWFVLFAAPDLALTQLLVEVLLFLLIIILFFKLPTVEPPRLTGWPRLRNILLALGMGLFGFVLVLLTAGEPFVPSISQELLRHSALGAHGGANVVNVILVDFRGYDTFGEMTVIAIAGLGVYNLVRSYRLRARRADRRGAAP